MAWDGRERCVVGDWGGAVVGVVLTMTVLVVFVGCAVGDGVCGAGLLVRLWGRGCAFWGGDAGMAAGVGRGGGVTRALGYAGQNVSAHGVRLGRRRAGACGCGAGGSGVGWGMGLVQFV